MDLFSGLEDTKIVLRKDSFFPNGMIPKLPTHWEALTSSVFQFPALTSKKK